jgi:hypothetical protein
MYFLNSLFQYLINKLRINKDIDENDKTIK